MDHKQTKKANHMWTKFQNDPGNDPVSMKDHSMDASTGYLQNILLIYHWCLDGGEGEFWDILSCTLFKHLRANWNQFNYIQNQIRGELHKIYFYY